MVAVLLLLCMSACTSKKDIAPIEKPGIKFMDSPSLSEVLDYAAEEDKLVFLDIYTDWCLPCKQMNKDVYSRKSTIDFLNDNFISYKVNGEKANGPDLVTIFQVESFPGIMFLNTKGRIIEKSLGGMTETQLLAMGNRALQSQL